MNGGEGDGGGDNDEEGEEGTEWMMGILLKGMMGEGNVRVCVGCVMVRRRNDMMHVDEIRHDMTPTTTTTATTTTTTTREGGARFCATAAAPRHSRVGTDAPQLAHGARRHG